MSFLKNILGKFPFPTIEINGNPVPINIFYKSKVESEKVFFEARDTAHQYLNSIDINTEPTTRACFMMCTPRSGSNLLAKVLHEHTSIMDAGEILSPTLAMSYPKHTSYEVLKAYMKKLLINSKANCTIFRIHNSHLEFHNLDAESLYKDFSNSLFLILYRKDLLKQYCSLVIANKTANWISTVDSKVEHLKEKIVIDYYDYKGFEKYIKNIYTNYLTVANHTNCLIISYEDLQQDPLSTAYESVLPFLQLPRQTLKVKTNKVGTDNLSEIIENYEEIKTKINDKERFFEL